MSAAVIACLERSARSAFALSFVPLAALGADQWKPLVDQVQYDPASLTTSEEPRRQTTVRVTAVWLRMAGRNERPALIRIQGTCSDRQFAITRYIETESDGTERDHGRRYEHLDDRPGLWGSVITAVCKKAAPWWKVF